MNTPGTAGGPGGRDQTLALKSRKIARKSACLRKKSKLPKKIFGDNNCQATHGARKHAWRTQAAWAKKTDFQAIFRLFMASVRSRQPGPPAVPGVF